MRHVAPSGPPAAAAEPPRIEARDGATQQRVLALQERDVASPRALVGPVGQLGPVASRSRELEGGVASQPAPHDALPVRRVERDLPDVVPPPPLPRPPQGPPGRYAAQRPRERRAVPRVAPKRLIADFEQQSNAGVHHRPPTR